MAYFETIKDKLEWEETKFESILGGNAALRKSIQPAKINRQEFFKDLDKGTFDDVVVKYFPLKETTFKDKLKRLPNSSFQSNISLAFHLEPIRTSLGLTSERTLSVKR